MSHAPVDGGLWELTQHGGLGEGRFVERQHYREADGDSQADVNTSEHRRKQRHVEHHPVQYIHLRAQDDNPHSKH